MSTLEWLGWFFIGLGAACIIIGGLGLALAYLSRRR